MSDNNGNTVTLKGMPMDEIFGVMSQTRTKGGYIPVIQAFEDSDEAMINVKDNFPLIADKNATTIYQGLTNAINKLGLDETVKVKKLGEVVYLAHTERLEILKAAMLDSDDNVDS